MKKRTASKEGDCGRTSSKRSILASRALSSTLMLNRGYRYNASRLTSQTPQPQQAAPFALHQRPASAIPGRASSYAQPAFLSRLPPYANENNDTGPPVPFQRESPFNTIRLISAQAQVTLRCRLRLFPYQGYLVTRPHASDARSGHSFHNPRKILNIKLNISTSRAMMNDRRGGKY